MNARQLQYEDVADVAHAAIYQGNRLGSSNRLFGQYDTTLMALPSMLVSDWTWNLIENVEVYCKPLSDRVFFSLTENGKIQTAMGGVTGQDVAATCYGGLFYWPEGCRHQLPKDQVVKGLSISMDTAYLSRLIGQESKWGESVARKLENGEPFWFGGAYQLAIPQLQDQLRQIRACDGLGLNRLLLEARVGELLFGQLEKIQAMQTGKPVFPGWKQSDLDKLYALRDFLDQHFLDDFSLARLVRISTLNEFKLKKGFRQVFGISVFRYIHQLRMEYAAQILRDTQYDIASIAVMTGYQHAHHFSAAFKNYFGLTPVRWKKGICNSLQVQ